MRQGRRADQNLFSWRFFLGGLGVLAFNNSVSERNLKETRFTCMRRITLSVSLLVLSVVASACAPRARTFVKNQPYAGPTQTMAEVVAEINANNAAVPTIWARHYFDANIVEPDGRTIFANGDGALLYKAPSDLRFVGNKPLNLNPLPLFEIGSVADRYWMTVAPVDGPSTMYWGWYRNVGKPCVDTRQLPIRPEQILQVLGVATINTNFLEPPVPTMRFNNYAFNGAGAYMFTWNVPLPGRWAAQKEIWYDRETKLPRSVILFDENGRMVLEAKLSRHEPLEVPETPQARWPKVAREFELFFPDSGSKLKFQLDEIALENKGVPTRRGIAFPSEAKADRVIQLDRDCADDK
jgi:hypothetical protein